MRYQHQPHPGEHVAHRSLDEGKGGAKTGVVEEYVGDKDSGIVIIQDDEGREGFDRRELVTLRGPQGGPVILHMRHLKAIFYNRRSFLAFVLALVLVLGLVSLSVQHHLSTLDTILTGLAALVADIFLLFKLIQRCR